MKPSRCVMLFLGVSLFMPQSFLSQYQNPLDEGVVILPAPNPPPTLQWPTQPYDWDASYRSGDRSFPPEPYPRSAWPTIRLIEAQYDMAYAQMRYNLSSILWMYKTRKDVSYLTEFVNQTNPAFQAPYFVDGDNGCADGFYGWGNKRAGVYEGGKWVGGNLQRNTWYSMRVEIKDTSLNGIPSTRLRTLFNNSMVFETFYHWSRWDVGSNSWEDNPIVYNHSGTISLLGGWSSTKFRNIVVRDLN